MYKKISVDTSCTLRIALLFIVLFMSACPSAARGWGEGRSFVARAWKAFTAPKLYIDSAWVFQPGVSPDVSISYKGKWNGVQIASPEQNYKLADKTIHSIGLYAGFGPFTIGYSRKLGQKEKAGQSLSLNWMASYYGLEFSYTNMADDMVQPIQSSTEVRLLAVNGYFAFNCKRFSYSSAYKGKLIQKRSAGSVMLAAKYLYGNFLLVGMEEYPMYMMHQASIGAGYSFNFVPYHRDMHNLTINLTGLPMLNVLNKLTIMHHTDLTDEPIHLQGAVMPGLVGKFAVAYTVGHVYLCAHFDYHFNRFQADNRTVSGNFDNWSGGFEIHYRF